MRSVIFGIALGTVIVAAAGCGGGNAENAAPATTGGTSGQTITVNESEFRLDPSTINVSQPGMVTIKVVNKGGVDHALEVEGNGVEEKSSTIGGGESTTLTVDLPKAGSYELYCPVDGHKNKGMKGTLTVGGSSASSVGATTGTNNDESGGGYSP